MKPIEELEYWKRDQSLLIARVGSEEKFGGELKTTEFLRLGKLKGSNCIFMK